VLPPALVKAVIAAESAFDPRAVSKAGALGLMQLMPQTAREMRVGDVFDPRTNIFGGTRYLRLMANRFAGDVRRTAAAYNAGPEAVERSRDIPNIPETRTYVQRVLKLYRHYLQNWRPEQPTAAPASPPR
jgi:soluble lytic murein transglycosylase-like protein